MRRAPAGHLENHGPFLGRGGQGWGNWDLDDGENEGAMVTATPMRHMPMWSREMDVSLGDKRLCVGRLVVHTKKFAKAALRSIWQ